MGRARKILHIFGRMNRGGAEMRTLDIMRRTDHTRFLCLFATLSGLPGHLDGEIVRLGGRVLPCRLNASFPWRFSQLIQQHDVKVVHSHVHHFSGFVLRCAHRSGVPVRIAHFRATRTCSQTCVQKFLQTPLMKFWINRYATHILGNGVGSLACGWRPNWIDDPRCAVIHNGLDPASFEVDVSADDVRSEFGWSPDTRMIIHVGRMVPEKNHSQLIQLICPILLREPKACFLMVGTTNEPIASHIRHTVRAHGLTSRVALAGVREDVPRLLKAADLMVFPSIHEGLPGAVLEACAAGVPVLASDLPGLREIAHGFPSVQVLPLCEGNDIWVEVALKTLRSRIKYCPKVALVNFRQSVYDIDLCVRAHELVWEGGNGESIRSLYKSPCLEKSRPREREGDVARSPECL